MSARRPLLSVVAPAFNEEDVLPAFHRALDAALAPLRDDYRVEIIYVDDGSTDGTLGVLRGLAAADPGVRYVALTRNFGHQAALTAGLAAARGDAVVSLDSDLQHPPELIPELVECWRAGCDVVQTVRADDPSLGLFKRLSSRAFYRLLRLVSGLDVPPAGADFRLLSRRAVDALLRLKERHRCLRGLVAWLGYPSCEVPFVPGPRAAGRTKFSLGRMLALGFDGLFAFSAAPLRLAAAVGFAAVMASAAVSLAVAAAAGPALALVVAVHAVGAAVLGVLAVLGEYAARLVEQARGRPLYVVKERSPARPRERRVVAR